MHNGEPCGSPLAYVLLVQRSGHAVVQIAGALDQAGHAATCLLDDCRRHALRACYGRLLPTALASATGFAAR